MGLPLCNSLQDVAYFHATYQTGLPHIARDGLLPKYCDLTNLRELDAYLRSGGYPKPRDVTQPLLFFTNKPDTMNNLSPESVLLGVKATPACASLITVGTDDDFGEFTSTKAIPASCLCLVPESMWGPFSPPRISKTVPFPSFINPVTI
jgi:hypothetical protein